MTRKKIGIAMGSDSDLTTMKEAMNILKEFEMDFDVHIISAHRSPERAHAYAVEAEKEYDVIIAGAGGAAHLGWRYCEFNPHPCYSYPCRQPDWVD